MIERQPNLNAPQEEEDGIKFEEIAYLLLGNWHWILISILVCLSIAIFKIKTTTPTYTRTTQVLIKNGDDNGGIMGGSVLSKDFSSIGIISGKSNIENEIGILCAPIMMQEAVKRIHADVQLQVRSGLRHVPLYGNSPISLLMPQANDNYACTFKMRLNGNRTAELYDFEDLNGLNEKHVTVKFGELAQTPVGTIVLQATPQWRAAFTDEEIVVNKYNLNAISTLYSSRLSVVQTNKEATILNIQINDESKQRAEDLLNKLIDVYNEQWIKDRNRIAESTYEFITNRLNDLSKELGDVDRKISDYKSKAMLPDESAAASMYLTQSTKNNDQLITLRNQQSVARYVRDYLNDHSKADQYLPTNTGIGSTGIEQMIAGYNQTVSTRNDLLTNTSENSPLVQKYNNDLNLQRQTIIHSLDNFIAQLQSTIASWQNTENKTNEKIAEAPQQVKQLLSIGRQQKVKETLYIYLLQKREENELSKTYTAWNTRIIQPPTGSNFPTEPRTNIILLIGLAVGFLIPSAFLFLRETMNHTIRGKADLDNLRMPVIGELPKINTSKKHWWERRKETERKVYIEPNNRNLVNEAFRILRTKMDFFIKSSNKDDKIIMLTSYNEGAGKSFISINLARVLALKGAKVLLVDLDLRHASTSKIINHPRQGLTNYLSGISDDLGSLIKYDVLGESTDLLPVGILPPNPAELLLNDRLGQMFEKLRQEYDYILLDCPPIEIVADTDIISKHADVTLFVIRAGLFDKRNLKDLEAIYNKKVYNRMTVLLNGTKYIQSKTGYGYRYGYRYGYHYTHSYYTQTK